MNDLPDAQQRLTRLLEFHAQNADDPFINHALGLEYVNANNAERAVIFFRSAIESDAAYVASYYHLGKALELLGKREEARKVYGDGMVMAKSLNDAHAQSELEAALALMSESSTHA